MNAKPTIISTADGSDTVSAGGLAYHSSHGAVQESRHVFIRAGFEKAVEKLPPGRSLRILEMGFGSGLNALLTALAAKNKDLKVHYTTIEKFPLQKDVWQQLNYEKLLDTERRFTSLHEADWNSEALITPAFTLKKMCADLVSFLSSTTGTPAYDVIFYDAFAPDDQPELWTPDIFKGLAALMAPGGILTTYCAQGQVRRNMLAAGFEVERIPGPPGKRQMMRAVKPL